MANGNNMACILGGCTDFLFPLQVQGAQATEEKLAKSLQGGNSKTDKATLKTLQSDFSQGIKVNKENAALVSIICTLLSQR